MFSSTPIVTANEISCIAADGLGLKTTLRFGKIILPLFLTGLCTLKEWISRKAGSISENRYSDDFIAHLPSLRFPTTGL